MYHSKGLSYATEKTYCHWVSRFIRYMGYYLSWLS
ncbi:phage integrase N-terminal SAM-like domain-containing protein [Oceaniserpentilla sp. 4NH20-0058]